MHVFHETVRSVWVVTTYSCFILHEFELIYIFEVIWLWAVFLFFFNVCDITLVYTGKLPFAAFYTLLFTNIVHACIFSGNYFTILC